MIISPTRELALQTYGVAKELFKYNELKTVGIVTGGMIKFSFFFDEKGRRRERENYCLLFYSFFKVCQKSQKKLSFVKDVMY